MDEKQRARLEELRADREKREKAKKEADELRELEREELERSLEKSTNGVRGEAFELVDNRFGLFALRAPDDSEIMRWDRAKPEERTSLDWMLQWLRPFLIPKERSIEWAQIAAMRPALCWDTATAFTVLLGANVDGATKK